MPTDLIQSELEIEIETVEIEPLCADARGIEGYPAPRLLPTGRTEKRKFNVIKLKNSALEVTIIPGLGGRIWSAVRVADNQPLWPVPDSAMLVSRAGARPGLPIGVEWLVGATRQSALGPVDARIIEGDAETGPTVILHELATGTPISWEGRIRLDPDQAAIRIAMRVQNRRLTSCRVPTGLSFSASGVVTVNDRYAVIQPTGHFTACHSEYSAHLRPEVVNDQLLWRDDGVLAPRQVRTHQFTLRPIALDAPVFAVGAGFAAAETEDGLTIAAVESARACRIFVLTPEGQTLETTADLYAEHPSTFTVPGPSRGLRGLSLRASDGQTALDWRAESGAATGIPTFELSAAQIWADSVLVSGDSADPNRLAAVAELPGWQASAMILLAHQAIRREDWADADACLERALGTNAEDGLAWWLKGLVRRRIADSDAEPAELLNAHYLSPMEPILRLDAMLAQPIAEGREPNPLIERLANDPDALLDAINLLIEAGLDLEMSRTLEESLRHRECAMARYLLAWSLLRRGRMDATAAEHVQRASVLPIEPPFPWRPLERTAVRDLAARFPDNERLKEYVALLDAAPGFE